MVLLEFDVLQDGHTKGIEVIERIGHPSFERAAIKSVSAWRYAPALREGVAVPTRNLRVAIPFRIHVKKVGATPEAKEQILAAFAAIEKMDVDGAKLVLAELDAWTWPNLYETQYRQLVRGIVSFLEGRSAEAIQELQRAMFFEGRFIGELGRFRSLIWTVRAAHKSEMKGEAYRALGVIERVQGENPLPWDITQIRHTLEELRAGSSPITQEAVIEPPSTPSQAAIGHYTPLRPISQIDAFGDSFPDRLRINCDDFEKNLTPKPGMQIEIPEGRTNCTIQLYGVPGTRVVFVEPPMI